VGLNLLIGMCLPLQKKFFEILGIKETINEKNIECYKSLGIKRVSLPYIQEDMLRELDCKSLDLLEDIST
jgi:hypothetical protein